MAVMWAAADAAATDAANAAACAGAEAAEVFGGICLYWYFDLWPWLCVLAQACILETYSLFFQGIFFLHAFCLWCNWCLIDATFARLVTLPLCWFLQDQTESAAILKIKESMQEEAKRFEKDTPTDPEYFGM